MAKSPKKDPFLDTLVSEESAPPVDPVVSPLPAPKIHLPPGESCLSCRYWNRMVQDHNYGECRRRLLSVLIPNRLTRYGPEGTFLITPASLWCGDYEKS